MRRVKTWMSWYDHKSSVTQGNIAELGHRLDVSSSGALHCDVLMLSFTKCILLSHVVAQLEGW
jgi:hypothetical protein